jgi:hypothetical protein
VVGEGDELLSGSGDRFGAEPVVGPVPELRGLDEASVAQHLEVPRHPGLVHPNLVDQLPNGALAGPHRVEDATTGRLSDHFQHGKGCGHGVSIRIPIYMYKLILALKSEPRVAEMVLIRT